MSDDDIVDRIAGDASAVPVGTPAAEVEIDEALVRDLLRDQHPDLADLPLQPFESGWDNEIVRLGDAWLVRLPRRETAAELALHEQRWLPRLAPRLPLPIPEPVRVGRPGRGYPWHWSVVRFIEGRSANLDPPRSDQAALWAEFLRALHRPAPHDAPRNPVRGVPLAARRAGFEARLRRLESDPRAASLVTPRLWQLWNEALAAPPATEALWLHGDLHARNVVVADGLLRAVIDWGDITGGDVAGDLSSAWMLFAEAEDRARVFEAYGVGSQALLARARGWAIGLGVVLLESGLADFPPHIEMGRQTLRRVLEDA